MISLEKNFLMHEPGRRPEASSGESKKRTCARRLREQRRVPLAQRDRERSRVWQVLLLRW